MTRPRRDGAPAGPLNRRAAERTAATVGRAARPSLLAGALLAALMISEVAAAQAPDTHHILILDDSGSMEREFDVHGFGLAVPRLFHRVLGADAAQGRLSVFLLPQRLAAGTVPRLAPRDYLNYPRNNGTFYAKAVRAALADARRSPADQVSVVLVTDAEPTDPLARQAIDRELARNDKLSFTCVQLGSHDEGDLCAGRAVHAADGFDMVQATTRHLAAAMDSVPRWGRLDGPGASAQIDLPPFVKRVHILLVGLRSGVSFRAQVTDEAGATHDAPVDQTRRLFDPAFPVPVGGITGERLALQTFSLDHDPTSRGAWTLSLPEADGATAYGVILEYDLVAALEVPAEVRADDPPFTARAHLTHRGKHFADKEFFDALGLSPTLVVDSDCRAPGACTPRRELPMALGADGWATVAVPLEGEGLLTSVARFTGARADMRSPAGRTRVIGGLAAALDPLPPAPTTPPDPAPTSPPATSGPADPAPASPPPPAPPKAAATRWVPPALDLPPWELEDRELGYAMTVTTFEGKQLTGAEIAEQGLEVDLVVDNQPTPMTLSGDRFEVRFNTGRPRIASFVVRLRWPGGAVSSNRDVMEVVPDAYVALQPTLDFGEVEAGCGVRTHCKTLDFSGSRSLDGVKLAATRTPGRWEALSLRIRHGERDLPVPTDAAVELVYDGAPIEVCYAPPRCEAPPEDVSQGLVLAPVDPRLRDPDRAGTTRAVAVVARNSWLDCNLWWVIIVGGTLLLLIIAYGYLRPYAFSPTATLQVADKERRLARDPGRPLRSVPQGRRGFYRSASCAIDASGFTVKRSRAHVLELRAQPGAQIALASRHATVERRSRGRWVPIDGAGERHLMSGAVYRVNRSFFFKVMA